MAAKRGEMHHNFKGGAYATPEDRKRTAERKEYMAEYQRNRREEERPFEASLLVCGRKGKYQMADEVRDMFEGLDGAPVMVVEYSTHQTMHMIHDFTPKLNIDDKNRVRKAVEHYEPYIDFDLLLDRTSKEV